MTATQAARADALGTGRIRVAGELRFPCVLGLPDLRTFPQRGCDVAFTCHRTGLRRHRFTGPLLLDVLRAAGPAFASEERKDRLRFLISLRAADGHHVVLSWAEIDPEFGDNSILLGLSQDGVPLTRPHLVVPGDTCGGRNISGIVEVRVHADTFA
jgi:hypothetical protein